MLTKRLSSHSIQTSEDYTSPMSRSTHERRSTASRRPSAIPRPSMTQERSASGSSQKGGTGGRVPSVKRTRTQSTPYPYDRDSGGATMPPVPALSNQTHSVALAPSSSRKADDRDRFSKIPKVAGGLRSESISGSGPFYSHARINSTQRQPPDQRMEVDELGETPNSYSYRNRNTQILNEPPPFSPSVSSMLSSDLQYEQSRLVGIYTQDAAPRPSTDSVERPFEHWYRGESTRNGGVGELRLGGSEMLDIAQFGHRPQPRVNPITGMVTMSVANTASLAVSRRAGSLDRSRSGDRESWFIDDKTREVMGFRGLHDKVMDESPLTDLEDVDGTTEGPESAVGHRGRQRESWRSSGRQAENATQSGEVQGQPPSRSTSTPPFARMDAMLQQQPPMASLTSIGPAASLVRQNSKKSTKSTKSAKSTTLSAGRRTPTSTKAMLTTPAKSATANGTPSAVRSPTVGRLSATTQKAKAKTPAKPKPRPAPKSTPAGTSEPDYLAFDSTTDDTLVDAIPVFSTPMPRDGNWDDMVLPTVAKKMGIGGYAVRTENGVVAKNDVVVPRKRDTMVAPVRGNKHLFGEALSDGSSRLQGHLIMITRRYMRETILRWTNLADDSPNLHLNLLLYQRSAVHGRRPRLHFRSTSRRLSLKRHLHPSSFDQGGRKSLRRLLSVRRA